MQLARYLRDIDLHTYHNISLTISVIFDRFDNMQMCKLTLDKSRIPPVTGNSTR